MNTSTTNNPLDHLSLEQWKQLSNDVRKRMENKRKEGQFVEYHSTLQRVLKERFGQRSS